MKIVKTNRKRSYKLDKLSVDDFVRLGCGSRKQYYELTGNKPPKVKEPEPVKEVKKGAGK